MSLTAAPLRLSTASADFEAQFAARLHWSADTDSAIEQRVADILADVKKRGDAAVLDYIRQCGQTSWHPIGTCKMGTDAMAVVDPQLRVKGVQALRVIDSSIMPTMPSSNTNAASIAIGEKGADCILQHPFKVNA